MSKAKLFFAAVILCFSSTLVFGQGATVDTKTQPKTPDPCTSGHDFATTDCALTWHGITLYGAYDAGVGWGSHGLPENGYNYEGESLVNRNGYQHRFLIAPNNLQQTGLGIRGKEEFLPGWSVVFNASTGINPQSGLLANASETDIINNGLPRASYSIAIDGARAGQPFNDEIYGGVSSEHVGTLTFGRQRALGTDAMLLYDPASGSYAFSYIGYNGTMAGGGDTEDSRWDDALKYRIVYGRSILALCINLPMAMVVATRPLPRLEIAGLPATARRNRHITTPMDLTAAQKQTSSQPTSFSNITTRRLAY